MFSSWDRTFFPSWDRTSWIEQLGCTFFHRKNVCYVWRRNMGSGRTPCGEYQAASCFGLSKTRKCLDVFFYRIFAGIRVCMAQNHFLSFLFFLLVLLMLACTHAQVQTIPPQCPITPTKQSDRRITHNLTTSLITSSPQSQPLLVLIFHLHAHRLSSLFTLRVTF